jgi:hypothetical protein
MIRENNLEMFDTADNAYNVDKKLIILRLDRW